MNKLTFSTIFHYEIIFLSYFHHYLIRGNVMSQPGRTAAALSSGLILVTSQVEVYICICLRIKGLRVKPRSPEESDRADHGDHMILTMESSYKLNENVEKVHFRIMKC